MKKFFYFFFISLIISFLFLGNIKNIFHKINKIYLVERFNLCIGSIKNSTKKPTDIFVAGHSYGNPSDNNLGTYPKFLEYLEQNKIYNKLIILAGDIIKTSSNSNFILVKKEMNKFFKKTIVAPGNHDVGLGRKTPERKIFNKNFGLTYQFSIINNNLFIILDTPFDTGRISDDQLNFIKDLKKIDKIFYNIFVITHHVIWQNNVNKKLQSSAKSNFFDDGNFIELKTLVENISYSDNIYFIAGDVSVTNKATKLYCEKNGDIYYLLTGMGSRIYDNFLRIFFKNNGKEVIIEPIFF